jgi:transcriptional regulator with XRE-family HTH domain
MSGTEEEQQHQYSSEWLESVDWDGWDKPAPPPVIFGGDQKREQTELVRVIGARMQEARDLCNLSQSEAARRIGYANSSKLSKVEGATDTNSVPLWLIVRVAKVYEVSVDFLFGLTDDWEVGVPRGVQPWLFDAWEKARQRDLAALERLHREIAAVSQHTSELVAGIAGATDALAILRTRAPAFDDLPASASLAGRLERLHERARAADAALKRFRLGLSPDTSRAGQKGAAR